MIGSEAASVAVCFVSRIGFPHPIKNSWSGATPSRALGQLGGATIPDALPSLEA